LGVSAVSGIMPVTSAKNVHVASWLVHFPLTEYYRTRTQKFVLYTEDYTDVEILRQLAEILRNAQSGVSAEQRRGAEIIVRKDLWTHYMHSPDPKSVYPHFSAMQEARPDLRALLLTDRRDSQPPARKGLRYFQWKRREIENYMFTGRSLETAISKLAQQEGKSILKEQIDECISYHIPKGADNRHYANKWVQHRFWNDSKGSAVLADVFEYLKKEFGGPLLWKGRFHELVSFMTIDDIVEEVKEFFSAVDRAQMAEP